MSNASAISSKARLSGWVKDPSGLPREIRIARQAGLFFHMRCNQQTAAHFGGLWSGTKRRAQCLQDFTVALILHEGDKLAVTGGRCAG